MRHRFELTAPRRLFLAGVILAAAATALAPAGPAETDTPWTLIAASGDVHSRGAPLTWQSAGRGDRLADGMWLRTGPDGRATLARGQYVVIVDPETEIHLLPPREADGVTRVRQDAGSATYRVEKGKKRRFEVITPYLVAGVKGTVFRVDVTRDFAHVEVSEGVVGIRSREMEATTDLHRGEALRIDALPGRHPVVTRFDVDRPVDTVGAGDERPARLSKDGVRSRDFTRAEMDELRKEMDDGGLLDDLEKENEREFFMDDDVQVLDDELKLRESELAGSGGKTTPQQQPN